MFKKFISYLIIFSILISDLAGWGNRSASAMMASDEESEGRSFIPVQLKNLPEETPLQDDFLEDISGPKPLMNSDRESSPTVGEKEPEEQERKDHIIPDLSQGIAPSNVVGEGLSLSSSKHVPLSLILSSPRDEGAKDLSKGDASYTTSSGEREDATFAEKIDRKEVPSESPVEKEHAFSSDLPLSEPTGRLTLTSLSSESSNLLLSSSIKDPEPSLEKGLNLNTTQGGSTDEILTTPLTNLSTQNEEVQSKSEGEKDFVVALHQDAEKRAEEKDTAPEKRPLEKFEKKIEPALITKNAKEKLTEEKVSIPLEQHASVQEDQQSPSSFLSSDGVDGNPKDSPHSLDVLLEVKLEASTKEQDVPQTPSLKEGIEEKVEATNLIQNEIQEAGDGQNTLSITVPDETIRSLPEKTVIEEKLLEKKGQFTPVQEELAQTLLSLLIEEKLNPQQKESKKKSEPFVLNDGQKNEEPHNTPSSIIIADEKSSLLSNKKPSLYVEKSQKKKDNLNKDWELVGAESEEEIILKRKSDGLNTDHSDGASFEGDIRGTKSWSSQELDENLTESFPRQEKTPLIPSKTKESNPGNISDLDADFKGDGAKNAQDPNPPSQNTKRDDSGSLGDSDEEDDSWEELNRNLVKYDPPLPRSQQSWTELTALQKTLRKGGKVNSYSGDFNKQQSALGKKRISFPSQGLRINADGESELEDFSEYEGFSVVPFNQALNLSPEVEDFLRYVKVRIIDGALNWKQKVGIGVGVLTGAMVAWPWMVIMFNNLLYVYAHNVDGYYHSNTEALPTVDPDVLDAQFRNFNSHLNFKTMMGLVGIPMGVSVASRTASILIDFMKDSLHPFSIQKSPKHTLALLVAKGSAYVGAFFAGLLPVYYLFHSLLGCDLSDGFQMNNNTGYEYYISTDIFLNIPTHVIINPNNNNCTFQTLPKENFQLFVTWGGFLFLSTFLRYGHQVSKTLEKWVNDYFFVKEEDTSFLTFEAIRQKYLAQFKGLIGIMEKEDVNDLSPLYNAVFLHTLRNIEQNAGINSEDSRGFEYLRVFKVFQDFYHQHKDGLEEETTDVWKRTWASSLGGAIPLVATFGRMIIFQYVIAEFLGRFWSNPNHSNDSNYIDYIQPSTGATTLSCILGFSLPHLVQGFVEKEAVEECIYEIWGGKKLTHGNSHVPLRVGLKIWDYLYGAFHTLPYLLIGFAATTNYINWPNLYQFNFQFFPFPFNVGQILFLLSFGIADVFNNTAAFHQSSSTLVNGFDSLLSYFYAFGAFKRRKLICATHQLQQLFKEITPSILQQVHQILDENYESDTNVLSKNGAQKNMIGIMEKADIGSPLSGDHSVFKELLGNEENAKANPYSHHDLSFEAQELLQYIKRKVVQGTLNWRQKTGIVGGMITGFAISWPMMAIIFYGLLTPYFQTFRPSSFLFFPTPMSVSLVGDESPAVITEGLARFNKYTNFYLLATFIGLPLGIDAASRTATILSNMTAENPSFFSIQKTRIHFLILLGAKGGLYFGTFFASILPVYYLYDSLFGSFKDPCSNLTCGKLQGWLFCPSNFNGTEFYCPNGIPYCPGNLTGYVYTYSVSTDILFNITGIINSPHFCGDAVELSRKILFGIGAPFLFFDTFLQYGYKFSSTVEKWINNFFFAEMRDSSKLSSLKVTRTKYLTQFKNLKHIIYGLEANEIDSLYGDVFVNQENSIDPDAEMNSERVTMDGAPYILSVFQNFHGQHQKKLENNEEEDWKKNWASRMGWAIPLIATFGRILIFQYVLEGMLGSFWSPTIGATILSCILGGIFANIIQGWMEKDAVEKGVYDLLSGKKIPEESSHALLRRSIKAWDYIYGLFNTLPYLAVGLNAAGHTGSLTSLLPWQILLLISFGLADAFNNAVAFHDSNLGVVNAYDSLVATYWEPSTEYKRDKLIRMTRQLRRLFKDLRPDVLEEVDRKLQKGRKDFEQTEHEDDYEQEEYEEQTNHKYDYEQDKYKHLKREGYDEI